MNTTMTALRRTLLSAGFAAVVLVLSPIVRAAPTVGQAAPAFTATDASGQKVALDQYRGKTVVLEWTNYECPYVKKHYDSGSMQALQKEATGNGVVWLQVVSSAPGQQGYVTTANADKLVVKDRSASVTRLLLDPAGTLGHQYAAKTTPHMYIVDATGKLVYMGGIDDKPTASQADLKGARNYVRAALADIAANRPVATPVSRPYGCSVKYAS